MCDDNEERRTCPKCGKAMYEESDVIKGLCVRVYWACCACPYIEVQWEISDDHDG